MTPLRETLSDMTLKGYCATPARPNANRHKGGDTRGAQSLPFREKGTHLP